MDTGIPALDWILDEKNGFEQRLALVRLEWVKAHEELDIYQAIVDADFDNAFDGLWNTYHFAFFSPVDNYKDLGEKLLVDTVDSDLMEYIDTERYGRNFDEEVGGKFINGGYCFRI